MNKLYYKTDEGRYDVLVLEIVVNCTCCDDPPMCHCICTVSLFLTVSLRRAGQYFLSSSIFDLVPCLQSVGMSSPRNLHSQRFRTNVVTFSPQAVAKPPYIVFCFIGKFQQVLRALPS